jgi:hypothetical protein
MVYTESLGIYFSQIKGHTYSFSCLSQVAVLVCGDSAAAEWLDREVEASVM